MQNFISVFSVYFPASIGILAGANVSGDLKVCFTAKHVTQTKLDIINHLLKNHGTLKTRIPIRPFQKELYWPLLYVAFRTLE